MKIIPETIAALTVVIFSGCGAEHSEIRNQAVKREVLVRRQFSGGRISEIAQSVSPDGQKRLIILGPPEVIILHEHDPKIEEFPLVACGSPRIVEFPGENPLIYCRGEGFGPIYL